MNLTDIVFVFSIQHTGTWFTIKFLQNFFPDTKEASVVIDGRKQIDKPTIIHSHFPILYGLNMGLDMDHQSRRQLFFKDRAVSLRTIDLLCNICKVVIPVRDPLAAILTRESRNPDLRHFYIVDGFVEIAEKYMNHPNIIFLPVDLPWTKEQRENKLLEIMNHCNINAEPHRELVAKIAAEWEPQNVTPGNRFKELYKNKDIDQIRFLLGPKWAEVEYLKSMAVIIHPFLVSVGYAKGDIDLW